MHKKVVLLMSLIKKNKERSRFKNLIYSQIIKEGIVMIKKINILQK